ncbi:ABC transporter ATP-binding protein, partial [Methylobacterium sp. J-088]|nr:ABC transporter ATP-binding protein [Methylobacterium sp. J-088]
PVRVCPWVLGRLWKVLGPIRRTATITGRPGRTNLASGHPNAARVYVLERGRMVWGGPPQRFARGMGAAKL